MAQWVASGNNPKENTDIAETDLIISYNQIISLYLHPNLNPMELQPKDTALLVKIKHSKPIEVKDFVATINAMGNLFDGFCRANGDSSEARKAKLYVEKIEHGSIEIFLTEAVTALALPFMENMNLIMEFAGHIKDVIYYFTKGLGTKPELSLPELRNYHDVFAVTAGDNKGETQIGAIRIGDTHNVYNNCVFNYQDSNSSQNQIQRTEQELRDELPTETVYRRRLLTIHQMRSDSNTDKGNQGHIDELNKRPLSLVFESDELKNRILYSSENPTLQAYLVDVVVLTTGGRPVAYKVTDLHDIIPL